VELRDRGEVGEIRPSRRRAPRRTLLSDEISFRKRHRYLTVVTDHDTGNVVWVCEGKTSDVLKTFFVALGPACSSIEVVTMDMSQAEQKAVRETLPNAGE
jgi:transposase